MAACIRHLFDNSEQLRGLVVLQRVAPHWAMSALPSRQCFYGMNQRSHKDDELIQQLATIDPRPCSRLTAALSGLCFGRQGQNSHP